MSVTTHRTRRPEILVAPCVTFVAVLAMIGLARVYDRLPVKPTICGFKETFGIPCAGCGGTRSMIALAHGHFLQALHFNPGVILGVIAAFGWLIHGWIRFQRGDDLLPAEQHNRRVKTVALSVLSILTVNWIYLLIFLE